MMGTVVLQDRPMLRTCDCPGCETFTLGLFCLVHEPKSSQMSFVRGRPHPRVADERVIQLRLPKNTSA
jgi:hypothetical protein